MAIERIMHLVDLVLRCGKLPPGKTVEMTVGKRNEEIVIYDEFSSAPYTFYTTDTTLHGGRNGDRILRIIDPNLEKAEKRMEEMLNEDS